MVMGGLMHVTINGEPLDEVDCFNYLGSQVSADGGCERDVVHRVNERYSAWGALKDVLSNRGLPPVGSKWITSGGDYVDNSFTALGSSDPREVRLEL